MINKRGQGCCAGKGIASMKYTPSEGLLHSFIDTEQKEAWEAFLTSFKMHHHLNDQIEMLETALNLFGPTPYLHFKIACKYETRAQQQSGEQKRDLHEAAHHYSQALLLYPKHPYASRCFQNLCHLSSS